MSEKAMMKQDAAKGMQVTELLASVYEGCMAADTYLKLPVRSGQQFRVEAWIDVGCDSRGWSCDNWGTRSGPAGMPGYFVGGSLGYPNAPIGMLIGAITQIDTGGDGLDRTEALRIFTNNVLLIGERYEATSPLNGFLYLIFNDTWTWSDNKGAIKLRVTLY
jgi:hypothetical protein